MVTFQLQPPLGRWGILVVVESTATGLDVPTMGSTHRIEIRTNRAATKPPGALKPEPTLVPQVLQPACCCRVDRRPLRNKCPYWRLASLSGFTERLLNLELGCFIV
ncbi:MAG: hypothetical protein CMJ62_20920 [Planctomycetaceae bacterium]|nr:hypothetical protein [Planctomycetaceae bacterium]